MRESLFNISAEQALLGALLVNNDVIERVDGIIAPAHFYEPVHVNIYNSIVDMIKAGRVASPVTLASQFRTESDADGGNGSWNVAGYLGTLAANATTLVNAPSYAKVIFDLAVRRGLVELCERTIHAATTADVAADPKELITSAETAFYELGQTGRVSVEAQSIYDAAADAITVAEEARANGGGLVGISSGIPELDAITGGFGPGDLIIIAARPSEGKSALMKDIAMAAAGAGESVEIFSMEMSKKQVAARMLAHLSNVSASLMRRGAHGAAGLSAMQSARETMRYYRISVDDTPAITIGNLSVKARRAKRKRGTTMILVDYLQLMKGSGKSFNRVGEVTEITGGLKQLALELGVPIIALAQLSRESLKREDKRPQLGDLRESGSIEQDADAVIMIHHTKNDDGSGAGDGFGMTEAELILPKNRHGERATAFVYWDGPRTAFVSKSAPTQEMAA